MVELEVDTHPDT